MRVKLALLGLLAVATHAIEFESDDVNVIHRMFLKGRRDHSRRRLGCEGKPYCGHTTCTACKNKCRNRVDTLLDQSDHDRIQYCGFGGQRCGTCAVYGGLGGPAMFVGGILGLSGGVTAWVNDVNANLNAADFVTDRYNMDYVVDF